MDRRSSGLNQTHLPLGAEGGGNLLHNLLLFGRVCKALGMDVTPDRMIDAARALRWIPLGSRSTFYHTLRALMVTRRRDLQRFDIVFSHFWQIPINDDDVVIDETPQIGQMTIRRDAEVSVDLGENGEPHYGDLSLISLVPTYSQQETLRHKDFATMSESELAVMRELMSRMTTIPGFRKTRRFQSGKGQQIDLRQAFRDQVRFGGELLILPTRRPAFKPRPLILICDISGSMERYTRILLHFMHVLVSQTVRIESFVFATRLTRITHQLRGKSVDAALRDVGRHVGDWSSGTRTGESLRTFNFRWGRRVLGRGAIVLLITDGWDRGDPTLLRQETARLQRGCYRLIWLNPLLGTPDYEPLTQGAQAMRPFVDDFLPAHNLVSLEALVHRLQQPESHRSGRWREHVSDVAAS